MESGSPLPPLPRSYDDTAVCQLYPLHDAFLARDMEQPRFSRTQEGEWFVRIAKDVRGNECAVRTCFLFSPLSSPLNAAFILYIFYFKKRLTQLNAGSEPSRFRINESFAILFRH